MTDRINKPVYAGREATTPELQVGGVVVLKGQEWEIVALSGQGVTVERNGIRRVGRQSTWIYHAPIKDVSGVPEVFPDTLSGQVTTVMAGTTGDSDDLLTVQEYLRAVGMPEEDLQGNAKTFGTVVMKLYRERHGKSAKPAKKLEYVKYLDVNGLEAQRPNDQAPKHLRVRANGWYESNAFEASDIDLLDQVAKVRHPSLPSLPEAIDSAIVALGEFGTALDDARAKDVPAVEVIWLVEKAVQQCLNSGTICGHAECARRRSRQSRRINSADFEDWS